MDNIKSDREKKIDNFLKQMQNQNEWEGKMKQLLKELRNKFKDELEDYAFVKDVETLYQLKTGGYIRYINLNNKLKWGGILIKVYPDKKRDRNLMVLLSQNSKRFVVSFEKNYIFYKNHTTYTDKTRKLFISFLDKYKDD
jgi:hypothetical protein